MKPGEVRPRCPACGQVVTLVRLRKRSTNGALTIGEHQTRGGKVCHTSGSLVEDGGRRK